MKFSESASNAAPTARCSDLRHSETVAPAACADTTAQRTVTR